MKKIVWIVVALITLAYPVLVYYGLNSLSPRHFLLLIIPVFFIRWGMLRKQNSATSHLMVIPALLGILLCFVAFIINSPTMIKLYPAFMSFTLLTVFIHSLFSPPSIITSIAQGLSKERLPEEAVNYTRKVTMAWCLFFLLNGVVAILTATEFSMKVWTLYNGFISYMIMGTLFLGEIIFRFFSKRRQMARA